MKPDSLTRVHYPALDGLRGIAILLVLYHHNFNFLPYFKFGWVGVDLFFVLSGFLITDILLKTKENKNFLQNFYIRRILRIFPLYYMTVLLFFLVAPFLGQLREQYTYYQAHQGMLWMHLQNWLSIFHEHPGNNMLFGHFWSLSVEEQFYLIWPFVILISRNMRRLVHFIYCILAACILLRFCSWLYFGTNNTNFNLQYMTRADGLCIGSLVAIWRSSNLNIFKKKIFQLSFVLLSVHALIFLLAKTVFPGLPHFTFLGFTSIAAIISVILVYAIEKRNVWTKFLLENRPLRYIGKISYGLYVYHVPIWILFKIYLFNIVLGLGFGYLLSHIFIAISSAAVAIGVSILSYNLLERKILALKDVVTADGYFTRLRQKIILLLRPASAK